MTEKQMRERIKEIEKERNKLKSEREEYERLLLDKKLSEVVEEHKKYVGKCFGAMNLPENNQKSIQAFKIIKVLEVPRENYAECICFIDGFESKSWNVYGIQIQTLGLWTPNTLRMMSKDTDPKVIDFYKEISQEKFESLYRFWNDTLEDALHE